MKVTLGETKYKLAVSEEYDESSSSSIDKLSGQKVWECSIDLCLMLQRLEIPKGLRVLELGCGHGLPGLVCLSKGCTVYFQDYSKHTLDRFTRNNVQLNFPESIDACKFSSGAWADFDIVDRFDLILCCEGIYSVEHFPSLASILRRNLEPKTGVAFFAGKRYYFGCGGGTSVFANYLGPEFASETLASIEDGKSNIRDILKIRLVSRCCV